jgi:hypothetical protein
LRVDDAVIMPISYICQDNASVINSNLSKTPEGRALFGYLSQHGSDIDIPPPAATTNSSASQHAQHPFTIESLFGARSALTGSGLGLFAQLLNPQLAEGATMHVGTSDSGDSNSGRVHVLIMRGQSQSAPQNASN